MRILSIKNVKFSGYYFYMSSNIQEDFQICISVPLTSRELGTSSTDLRKTFTQLIKWVRIEELETTPSLKAVTACRLIPLDKEPGLRTIGVGKFLGKIAGKVILIFMKDITDAAGPLQLSAGQETGTEAAIHAMRDISANEDTEAVLLIDAENSFNSISRKAMLHNLNFVCQIITTYINNCCITPARLFIIGGRVIQQLWGRTH